MKKTIEEPAELSPLEMAELVSQFRELRAVHDCGERAPCRNADLHRGERGDDRVKVVLARLVPSEGDVCVAEVEDFADSTPSVTPIASLRGRRPPLPSRF